MLQAAVTWLLNTRLGQFISAAFSALFAVLLIYFHGRSTGKKAEQQKQDRQSLENLRSRSKTDAKVEKMPADERRDALGQWVSDDE